MRAIDWLFFTGVLLFVGGAALVLQATEGRSGTLFWIGLAGLGAGVVCFAVGAWRVHTHVDWERIAAEQRLWRSGPLGRAWLKLRKLLLG